MIPLHQFSSGLGCCCFLSRERERELFGPKKRGPKLKTFLMKVQEPRSEMIIIYVYYSTIALLLQKNHERHEGLKIKVRGTVAVEEPLLVLGREKEKLSVSQ